MYTPKIMRQLISTTRNLLCCNSMYFISNKASRFGLWLHMLLVNIKDHRHTIRGKDYSCIAFCMHCSPTKLDGDASSIVCMQYMQGKATAIYSMHWSFMLDNMKHGYAMCVKSFIYVTQCMLAKGYSYASEYM